VENFKPNWLAIFAVLIGLIAIGFLLGKISSMPDGQTLHCPEEDWVQIQGTSDPVLHVLVYCEPPASN
jgi:hypothetical protein